MRDWLVIFAKKQNGKIGVVDDRLSDSGKKHQEQPLDPQVPVPSFKISQSQRQKHQEQQLSLPPPQQHEQQQKEMKGLQQERRNVAADIAKIEQKIDIVEQNIKVIEEKLESNFSSNALNDKSEMYYLDKLKDLREERKDLREQGKNLRDKEKDLRNEARILLQLQQQTNQSHGRSPFYCNTRSTTELKMP